MTFDIKETPRRFTVKGVTLEHVADVALADDQLVTFRRGATEYDVTCKDWGYYATPSLNRRLPAHGLKPMLVRADDGAYFVMLTEPERMESFLTYLASQNESVICALDDPDALTRIAAACAPETCGVCGGPLRRAAVFDAPPPGETDFGITPYRRELRRCGRCGHVVNKHDMDLSALYEGRYWDATYAGQHRATFERIMNLPPEQSDNRQRTQRVDAFARARFGGQARRLLDVGSGLAVFPAVMRDLGWSCAVIDPDPTAVRHAQDCAGVSGYCGDFLKSSIKERFDVVTLNKVLEHVPDMAAMLRKCRELLTSDGVLYVEVPDGEAALQDSPAREEFFIDHFCAFSAASLALLCAQAGFTAHNLERIREPSGKYTLYTFLTAAPGDGR